MGRSTIELLLAAALGAAITLALQAFVFDAAPEAELAPDSVALVGDKSIGFGRFQSRVIKETGLDPEQVPLAERKKIVQKMVEERLLHEYLRTSGMLHSDAELLEQVREAVAKSLGSKAPDAGVPPEEAVLNRFYSEHGAQFREPSRLALERMVFRGSGALQQAELAHARLSEGESFVSVKAQLAGPDLVKLPAAPLSVQAWKEHLGDEVAQAISNLPRDHFTAPLASEGGFAILRVSHSVPARKPPLGEVRAGVLLAYEARLRANALQALLRELQEQHTVLFNQAVVETLKVAD